MSLYADYADVRSTTVPALRSKTQRKRYKHVNAALLGSLASQDTTPGISRHMHERVVWNNKNKFKMPPRYPSPASQPSQPHGGAPRLDRKFLAEEIDLAHQTNDVLLSPYEASGSSESEYEEDDAALAQMLALESRGEQIWDAVIKGAEEKYEEGVFRKEWEVVEEEREDVIREVDGFELV